MLLKRGLLAFWAVWYGLAFTSNLVRLLNYWGALYPHWRFASKNWDLLQEKTKLYNHPLWLDTLLFCGVLAWELLAAFLFLYACVALRRKDPHPWRAAYPAFTVGSLLWAAFLIADEALLAFPLEEIHMRILMAHLGTLLVVVLLPEARQQHPADGR
jgi:hypothetical protein